MEFIFAKLICEFLRHTWRHAC